MSSSSLASKTSFKELPSISKSGRPKAAEKDSNGIGCLPWFLAIVFVVACVLIVGYLAGWFETSLPITLKLNEDLELSDREVEISGTVITAPEGNNEIIIRNCKIKADRLLESSGNLSIHIINSVIITQNEAILSSRCPKIFIDLNSVVKSVHSSAIRDMSDNSGTISVKKSTVEGKRNGIEAKRGSTVSVSGGSKIIGGRSGIQTGDGLTLNLDDSLVTGEVTGLVSDHGNKVTMANSHITAPVAINFGTATTIQMSSGSIKGKSAGIILETGTVQLDDGVISGEIAVHEPQGVGIKVIMEGGQILGKTHGILGAGDVDLFMNSGLINGNIAVLSDKERGLSKMTITGGKIEGKDNGIIVVDTINAQLNGGEIIGDTALKFGNGSTIAVGGTKVTGRNVGIHGDERFLISGHSGTVTGGQHAFIVTGDIQIPETGFTIEGSIKREPPKPDPNPGQVMIRVFK